jgi:protein-disulfide isomerase
MKTFAWVAAVLLATAVASGCEKQPSKLDQLAPGGAAMPRGDLEARVARLEKSLAAREEALQFLDMAYESQVEQQTKPVPGTVYGVDIKKDIERGQVLGDINAPVTIVKAWDFACPHCYRSSLVLDELLKEYEGKIRVVLKHMVVHPQQVAKAHQALCASAKQNKFKEFYKDFWEKAYKPYMDSRGQEQGSMSEENVYKIAGEAGMNVDQLKADMGACEAVIAEDEAELRKFRVSGTPAFFINGEFIGGGIPKEAFKQVIDKKLQIAQASGVPAAEYYEKEIRAKGEQSVQRRRAGRGGGADDGHGH